jgi:hypothetical protein
MNQQIIVSVKANAPALLTIAWRTGKQTKVDLSDYLDSPGYELLKNPTFFCRCGGEGMGTWGGVGGW